MTFRVDKADYFEIVEELNRQGWYVLNGFQYGWGERLTWRVNLNFRNPATGGTVDGAYGEFCDHADPLVAMRAAYVRAQITLPVILKRLKQGAPEKAPVTKYAEKTAPVMGHGIPLGGYALTPKEEKRLEAAFDRLWFAVKTSGTGSNNRTERL